MSPGYDEIQDELNEDLQDKVNSLNSEVFKNAASVDPTRNRSLTQEEREAWDKVAQTGRDRYEE